MTLPHKMKFGVTWLYRTRWSLEWHDFTAQDEVWSDMTLPHKMKLKRHDFTAQDEVWSDMTLPHKMKLETWLYHTRWSWKRYDFTTLDEVEETWLYHTRWSLEWHDFTTQDEVDETWLFTTQDEVWCSKKITVLMCIKGYKSCICQLINISLPKDFPVPENVCFQERCSPTVHHFQYWGVGNIP